MAGFHGGRRICEPETQLHQQPDCIIPFACPQRDGTYIIILGESKEPADLGGPLGTESLGMRDIGQAGNIVLALLDNDEGKDREVVADDATTDGLPLALSGAAGAVARMAFGKQELDTGGQKNTLLHRETLLVVAARDLEDVALELVADRVAGNLLAHALVQENTSAALVIDVDQLLGAIGGVAVEAREKPSAGGLSLFFRFDRVFAIVSRIPTQEVRNPQFFASLPPHLPPIPSL